MKIAVDARTMGSCPSGIGIYLYDFVKELVLGKENYRFDFLLISDVATSEQMDFFLKQGIPVICYGKRVFRSIGVYPYFNFVRKTLIKEKADLFWEPNNLLPLRMRGYHGKLVLTIHDLFPMTTPEYFPWFYRIYFQIGLRRSSKLADALLFDSKETQKLAQTAFPIISGKRNFVSYLIVQKPPVKTICDDGFFLYIGNLEKRKGTDLLLRAYRSYCKKGGKKPLYLGGNIREPDIESLLKKIQSECPRLRYLGYVNEDKKYTLLSKCSCFLFPSKAEGFGLPPLEAAGYYKPMIVSNLSIFHEILKMPVKTFALEGKEENQIEQLSRLMLEEDTGSYEKSFCSDTEASADTDCEAALKLSYDSTLKLYQSSILASKLARFFKEIMNEPVLEEIDESCI